MRALSEQLRYILLYGRLTKEGTDWVWMAAPDRSCVIKKLVGTSKWAIVETVYSALTEYATAIKE